MDYPFDVTESKVLRGDHCPCEGCDGRVWTYATVIKEAEDTRLRYFCCKTCKCPESHGVERIPLSLSPPRRSERKVLRRLTIIRPR